MAACVAYSVLLVLGTRLKTRVDRHTLVRESKIMRLTYLRRIAERKGLRLVGDDPDTNVDFDNTVGDVIIEDDDAMRQAA